VRTCVCVCVPERVCACTQAEVAEKKRQLQSKTGILCLAGCA